MFTLNCNGRMVQLDKPVVMGVINATPDSFYEGSRFQGLNGVMEQAERMLHDGAVIIDLGAQSTRPGSQRVSFEEELRRVMPAVESLSIHYPQSIISIDTFYSKVATEAVAAGAAIINDISAGGLDPAMMETAGNLHVPYVCMHIKGTPDTMHHQPQYENVSLEVLDYFISKCDVCRKAGIHDVIIDPGFGFGKTAVHNFQLVKDLSLFALVGKPILAGISRKSTIYKTLEITVEEALNGTTVLNTLCLLNGANILRVHDVKEAVEAVKLITAYRNATVAE